MRKLVLLSTLIGLIGFASCQKSNEANQSNTQLSTLNAVNPTNDGHVHNEIMRAYKNQYGLNRIDSILTKNQVNTIVNRVVSIAQNLGYIPDSLDIKQLSSDIFNSMLSNDYFNSLGNLKSLCDLNNITVSMIANTDFKNTIRNINNYDDSADSFLTFVHTNLNSLTGLSADDLRIRDAYNSIADSSYSFTLSVSVGSLALLPVRVAIADANGYIEGLNAAKANNRPAWAYPIWAAVFSNIRSTEEILRM